MGQKKNNSQGIDSYRKTEAQTASRENLLLMIYEGGLRFIGQAIEAVESKDHKKKLKYIDKTRLIVMELRNTLNFETGGEIARDLDNLYEYINIRLCEAEAETGQDILIEAEKLLGEVKAGWDGIAA